MAATLQEQLDSVQTAITTIESGGQAWTQGGRALTRADLKTLYAREKEILLRIASSSRGRRVTRFVPK